MLLHIYSNKAFYTHQTIEPARLKRKGCWMGIFRAGDHFYSGAQIIHTDVFSVERFASESPIAFFPYEPEHGHWSMFARDALIPNRYRADCALDDSPFSCKWSYPYSSSAKC